MKRKQRKTKKFFISVALLSEVTKGTIHIVDIASWRTKKGYAINPHIHYKTPKGYKQIYIANDLREDEVDKFWSSNIDWPSYRIEVKDSNDQL